jgi:hypothetical protein
MREIAARERRYSLFAARPRILERLDAQLDAMVVKPGIASVGLLPEIIMLPPLLGSRR